MIKNATKYRKKTQKKMELYIDSSFHPNFTVHIEKDNTLASFSLHPPEIVACRAACSLSSFPKIYI